MRDCIDRQMLLNRLDEMAGSPPEMCYAFAIIDEIKAYVKSLPSIDAEDPVTGEWIYRRFDKGWECSNCGSRCLLNYESDFHKSECCPHCGAHMTNHGVSQ